MSIPTDLQYLILSCLPLKHVQKYNCTDTTLINLLFIKYGITIQKIQSLRQIHSILTMSELYTYLCMIHGEIGYFGQDYFSVENCLLLAVCRGDFELLEYYLTIDCDISNSHKDKTMYAAL